MMEGPDPSRLVSEEEAARNGERTAIVRCPTCGWPHPVDYLEEKMRDNSQQELDL